MTEEERKERRGLLRLHRADDFCRKGVRDIDHAIDRLIIARETYSSVGGYGFRASQVQEHIYALQKLRDKIYTEI